MVKCRCGTWTNFGLTCAKCATDDWLFNESDSTEEPIDLDHLDEGDEEDEEDN